MATIYSDISLLHAPFSRRCEALAQDLIRAYETGRTKTFFKVFETYRSPMRQRDLIKKGVTKAGPLESAHQFGLAADFVPFLSPEEAAALSERIGERVWPGWNWHSSHDYRFLATRAEAFKLVVPISWDPCHVEHPSWREVRQSMKALEGA